MSSLFLFMIYYINKILILSVHIDFTTASFMVPPHTLVIRYKSLLKYKADKITICFSFMSLLMKINKFNFEKLCSRFLHTLNQEYNKSSDLYFNFCNLQLPQMHGNIPSPSSPCSSLAGDFGSTVLDKVTRKSMKNTRFRFLLN